MDIKELRRSIRLRSAEALTRGLRVLPEGMGRSMCAGLGRGAHAVAAGDRRIAHRNLARVHPDWDQDRIEETTREVFRELGRNCFDFLRYPGLSDDQRARLVTIPDGSPLEGPRAAGTGAIVVTGHLGCWEILAATLTRNGFPFKAMARPLREPRLEAALTRHRARMGVTTISSEGLPLAALRHLKKKGYLGVLADQRVRQGGVIVKFLGQPTVITEGPAKLALAANVPLIPFAIHRLPDHTHGVTVLDPIEPRGTVIEITQRIAEGLERLIAVSPAQWMWIHPRWEPIFDTEGRLVVPGGDPSCASG